MRTIFYTVLSLAVLAPVLAYGQTVYAPLVNIPGNQAGGFEQYINFLYGVSISIAALLAVVKIIIAGAKYMISDVVSNKGSAIEDIQGAILGLLLILGAVIILEFINPQLINGNIKFQPIPPPEGINNPSSVAVNEDGTVKDGVVLESITTYNIPKWSRNGNMVTVPFDESCQAKVNTELPNGVAGQRQAAYNTCVNSLEGQTKSYCGANYGNFRKTTTTYTCQLPTVIRRMTDFQAEFVAYKASLPANNYTGREATTMTEEVFEILCKSWNGVYKDNTNVNIGIQIGAEDRCVKYN